MPRGRKSKAGSDSRAIVENMSVAIDTDAGARLELTLRGDVESSLLDRIASLMQQAAGIKAGRRGSGFGPGRRGVGGRTGGDAAGQRLAEQGKGASDALGAESLASTLSGALPANHEQRIVLYALAAERAGADYFTTNDVKERANDLGVSQSTVPGSLSKLKKAGLLSARRFGRTALYGLTGRGRTLGERLAAGESVGTRRGRKPKAGSPSSKVGRPASGPGGRSRRPPSRLEDLSENDRQLVERLLSQEVDLAKFESLGTAKDRALWALQQYAADTPAGMTPSMISYLLSERVGARIPANGVGAALRKAEPQGLVNFDKPAGRYSITVEGRNYLEGRLD
jgi:DNA-binding transcriptional ArsR family regulator